GPDDGVLMTLVCCLYGRGPNRRGTVHEEDLRLHARQDVEILKGHGFESPPGEVWASFDGPARALRFAKSLVVAASRFGFEARAGVHTGACGLPGGGVAGSAARLTSHIGQQARPGEVLVSRTVKDLVSGAPFVFADRGTVPFDDT